MAASYWTSVIRHIARWPPEPRNLPISIGGVEIRRNIWPPESSVAHVTIETPPTKLLHSRDICPFSHHLELSAMQLRFIKGKSLLNSFNFKKLHISKTLWLTKFISKNSHSVYSATSLKMLLNFFRGTCVIYHFDSVSQFQDYLQHHHPPSTSAMKLHLDSLTQFKCSTHHFNSVLVLLGF